MKHILGAAVAAATLLAAGTAAASVAVAPTTEVDAVANSYSDHNGADTGFSFNLGDLFTVSVDPNQLWKNDPNDYYLANANGNTVQGDLTLDGFTAHVGALVGQIGNGDLFLVGTSFSGTANASGDLKLFYWDSDSYNNAGSVTATISAVPEPATMAMMGLGLAALGLSRRRKI